MRASRVANADSYKLSQFIYRIERNFKLSLEDYEALFETQGGVCELCKKPETKIHHVSGEVQRLAVDHDHACCPTVPTCGKCVRGLLCHECNTLLGKIERTPGLEAAIVSYLSN